MKKVYLAGPDVFHPDAVAIAAHHKALCLSHGFTPLHPVDQELIEPQAIYARNLALLNQADAVLANVQAFRGAEPDSGTSFEIGYARAKNIPVICYQASCNSVIAAVEKFFGPVLYDQSTEVWLDEQGKLIEDFDLPLNLMLACSSTMVVGDLKHALCALQKHFEILR